MFRTIVVTAALLASTGAEAQSYYARSKIAPSAVAPAEQKTYTGTWSISSYSDSSCVSGTKTGTPVTECSVKGVADPSKAACDPKAEPVQKTTSSCYRTCGTMVAGYYSNTMFITDKSVGNFGSKTAANLESARKACENYAGVPSTSFGYSCLMGQGGEVFVRTGSPGGSVSKGSNDASYAGAICS